LLAEINSNLDANATITHVSAQFLQEQRVRSWTGAGSLAGWINQENAGSAGFMRRSVAKAQAAGLTYRPDAETIRETLAFFHTLPAERQEQLASGLTPARERELLAAWKARG
jgi:2'-hydroxyisoflavone reductase